MLNNFKCIKFKLHIPTLRLTMHYSIKSRGIASSDFLNFLVYFLEMTLRHWCIFSFHIRNRNLWMDSIAKLFPKDVGIDTSHFLKYAIEVYCIANSYKALFIYKTHFRNHALKTRFLLSRSMFLRVVSRSVVCRKTRFLLNKKRVFQAWFLKCVL